LERVLDTGSPNRLKVETVAKALVIVESPAKAETISRYLGDEFVVESSVGHIRDLATKKELPPELQEESWAHLGVETENNFKPHYVTSEHGARTVRNLKKALKGASELYLATDEDREGEAIAWHLQKVLEPTVPVHRMVFHEITKRAITEAVSNCRELDGSLVSAQETRRILDRLYGFEVSDVTRKKVGGGASAGRVQSAATRLLVERERERMMWATDSATGKPRYSMQEIATAVAALRTRRELARTLDALVEAFELSVEELGHVA